jgi:DNA mismatch repair protein MutL
MENKSIIKILPENLANKIAAGEVVERPSSAVKELVENAIDADATKVSIIIEQGGKKLIQVVDNGTGMSEADLQTAFARHATSKIKSDEDLNSIDTLGFRGEALPSIASVSQVEIKSRIKTEEMGNIFYVNGGEGTRLEKKAANIGTSISIRNLFFNTPARRQFLKSDAAENQHILTILKRFFLAYPNISFDLMVDGRPVYQLKECEVDTRVREIFGDTIFEALLPLNNSLGGVKLQGFISRPDMVRRSRGHQYLFLNGRPIQSKSLNHAIFQAYTGLIEPGEYPIFCLFLEMDASLVDVNVHPTKMEVRFSNDRSLYYFFINSAKTILGSDTVLPNLHSNYIPPKKNVANEPAVIMQELKERTTSMAGKYSGGSGAQMSLAYFENNAVEKEEASIETSFASDPTSFQRSEANHFDKREKQSFWQIHNRYILSEIKSGFVIIDQHVAHERVLYEQIKKTLEAGKVAAGQKLLFPHKMNLNYEDFMALKGIMETLNNIGFSINIFSGNTIVIEAMPTDIKVGRESQILLDIIDYYRNNPLHSFSHHEKISAAYACKNAIKSGETLSQREMQNLIDQLFACETPFFCPHGRPIIVTMDLEELDRKFKRIK